MGEGGKVKYRWKKHEKGEDDRALGLVLMVLWMASTVLAVIYKDIPMYFIAVASYFTAWWKLQQAK
jgi:hypothetical protein